MRRLQESEPAELHERDVPPCELHLQGVAVMGGAEEHRLLAQQDPLFAVGEERPADLVGLRRFVEAGDEDRTAPALPVGPKRLRVASRRTGDHGIRRLQDRPRRSVVALERDHPGAGERLGKAQDVLNRRRPEGVDSLRVVADDHHFGRPRPQAREDRGLQGIRVLVFVHEHVIEGPCHPRTGSRVGHERVPEQQEIVVVEDVLRALAVGVGGEDGADAVQLRDAPGEAPIDHCAQALPRVDGARVYRGERILPREPALAASEPHLTADEIHQVGGVGLV